MTRGKKHGDYNRSTSRQFGAGLIIDKQQNGEKLFGHILARVHDTRKQT